MATMQNITLAWISYAQRTDNVCTKMFKNNTAWVYTCTAICVFLIGEICIRSGTSIATNDDSYNGGSVVHVLP